MHIDHWMTFSTFAEQRHFVYPSVHTYDGVIINANMVAHAPAGLAGFLVERTQGLKYIIDPLTHAFQHDPSAISAKGDSAKPKSSIQKLAEAYGDPVVSRVGVRPILPNHFEGQVLQGFVERCLAFQRNVLTQAMAQSDAAKYLDPEEVAPPPYALVAPYFYMTEVTLARWLPLCRRAAQHARQIEKDLKVFAALVVSQGVVLRKDLIEQITEAFHDLELDGFLLWVDDLDENGAGSSELMGLLHLAIGLRDGGRREVVNLHGGYFSVLAAGNLGESAMSGVAHGPEFGEYRAVVPVGGGIPIARYYIPKLHARMRYQDALEIFGKTGWLLDAGTFHRNVCDCPECLRTIAGNPGNFTQFGEGTPHVVRRGRGFTRINFPTAAAKLRCLQHYLERKQIEYQFAATVTRDQLLKHPQLGLRCDVSAYEQEASLDVTSHLELWASVFEPSPGSR